MSLHDEPFDIGDKVYPLLTASLWKHTVPPAYGIIIDKTKNNLVRIRKTHKFEPWRFAYGSTTFSKSFWTKIPTQDQLDREKEIERFKILYTHEMDLTYHVGYAINGYQQWERA